MGLIGALAWRFGAFRKPPPRRDVPWMVVRSVTEVGAATFYLTALMHLPMGEVSAIMQTMPLLITLAGAIFLGERVGWRRWAAILTGFAGMLVIVRPGGEAFDPFSLYAFAGMFCFMLRDLSTRFIGASTPSLLITFVTAAGVAVMGVAGVLWEGWRPMTGGQTGGLALAALFVFGGYYCGVLAMRRGEIAFTSPFRYSILCWALLLGFLVFDERPDALTLTGAAMIVGAGLYAFWRERRMARAAAPAETAPPPHALAPGARVRR
jgi:S-adenosylmethionine uptake transporter